MKKNVFVFLLFFSNFAWSEEIKLSCNINLTIQHSSGAMEQKNINEILEISILKNFTSIIPMGDDIGSITTFKDNNTTSVDDYSNDSKFDITKRYKVNNSSINDGQTTIRIDRNTGNIYYFKESNFKDGSQITSTGNGRCEKINLTKKKF